MGAFDSTYASVAGDARHRHRRDERPRDKTRTQARAAGQIRRARGAPSELLCEAKHAVAYKREDESGSGNCAVAEIAAEVVAGAVDVVAGEREEAARDGDAVRERVDEQHAWIDAVDGVTAHVGVEVGVAGGESERILVGPAANLGVVVAGAETEQARGFVVVTAGEAVGDDRLASDVLFEDAVGRVAVLLDDFAAGGVDDEADGADVVGDDAKEASVAVERPVRDPVFGDVGVEDFEVAGGVELGGDAAAGLEPRRRARAAHGARGAGAGRVVEVGDFFAARQGDALDVDLITRCLSA